MMTYPLDAKLRGELRDKHATRVLAIARAAATRYGLSMRCAGEGMAVQHAGAPGGGCANSGLTCLCECHDRGPRDITEKENGGVSDVH